MSVSERSKTERSVSRKNIKTGAKISLIQGYLKDHETKTHPHPIKMFSNNNENDVFFVEPVPFGNLIFGRRAISSVRQLGMIEASREWAVGMDEAPRDGRD